MGSWTWGSKNEGAAQRCDHEASAYRREEKRARATNSKRADDMGKHAKYYEDKAKSHRR